MPPDGVLILAKENSMSRSYLVAQSLKPRPQARSVWRMTMTLITLAFGGRASR